MFKQRSHTKELLDADNIPEEDLILNLKELDRINSLLGGYAISFSALKKVLKNHPAKMLVDIGCGGGDTLKQLHTFSTMNGYSLHFAGIDLKPVCINYSRENNKKHPDIWFVCDDYRNLHKHLPEADILHASLFCHHLDETELTELINYAIRQKKILIINDLERNVLAHYSIKFLTKLFSKSYLVKNDAPLSVLRGFKKKEWEKILQQSEAKNYTITWKWAFRHEVIVYHG